MGSVGNSLLSSANTLTNTPVTTSNTGATTVTSAGSSSSSSSSSDTNTTGIFTGTSAYSQDLQNVISRAVAIASMPITLLTNQQNALTAQSTELTTLDTDFTALQNAITGISTAMGGASYDSTSTAPSAVTASLATGATEGVYNITVNSVGAAATSLSSPWSQTSTLASGQTANYTLLVGNQQYSFTTSDNSAQGMAAAINSACGNQVNAVAVNVGNNVWALSLQSQNLGSGNLDLIQTPTGLQTQGTYAISQTTSPWASAAGTYSLVVGSTSYTLSPASDSAADVAAAINAAAVTNNLAVNATVAGNGIQLVGAAGGTGSLDIQVGGTSLQTQAPAASETSTTWNGTADATGTQSLYTLDVGSSTYQFTTAGGDNTAQTVAAAINQTAATNSLAVNATVVNVGTAATPDYRIALQNTGTASPTLNLQQSTSLQTQTGTPNAVSQTTSTWTSAAGTYNLLVNGTSAGSFAVTTNESAQDVATAINTLATTNSLNVSAMVVDLGTGGNHDYRIQLTGTTAGVTTLGIQNGSGPNLQTQVQATSLTGATWNATADVSATADATGTRSEYTLVDGTNTYNFVAADNSAQSVAAAINAQFGSQVTASVVDLGTNGAHDYRIALQDLSGTTPAPTLDIQKDASATSFQSQQTAGALANYSLDGSAAVNSTTDSVNVANGVTLNLLGTNANTAGTPQPVSVTVTQSSDAINTALTTFTSAYNTCVTEIVGQRGQSAGPLQGTSILTELSQALSSISTYGSSGGSFTTLHDMGLDLGDNGQLTYTSGTFLANCFGNAAGIDAFLGTAPDPNGATAAAVAGSGFLAVASNALTDLETPTTGLLKSAETDLTSQITDIGTQIATKQAQVDTLQTTLTAQMAAADAAIATMEQTYSELSSMLAAQQTSNQQYSGE